MDLAKDITETTVAVPIKHPGNSKFVGLTITLRSVNSPEVGVVRKRIENIALKMQRTRKVWDADEIRDNETELLIAATVKWEWGMDANGEPGNWKGVKSEFNGKNAHEVYALDFIRAQLQTALDDEARFFQS